MSQKDLQKTSALEESLAVFVEPKDIESASFSVDLQGSEQIIDVRLDKDVVSELEFVEEISDEVNNVLESIKDGEFRISGSGPFAKCLSLDKMSAFGRQAEMSSTVVVAT